MYGRRATNLLFWGNDLRSLLDQTAAAMRSEIDTYDKSDLLNTPVEDLAEYFVSKFDIEAIRLHEADIYVEQSEAKIDVSQDPARMVFDRSGPVYIDGTKVTVHIPFTGNADIFQCQASTYTTNPPRGRIEHEELILDFEITDTEAASLKGNIEGQIQQIKTHVGYTSSDMSGFSGRLRSEALASINARLGRLKSDQRLVAGLGYKLKARPDAPRTFVVPDVKRKLRPPVPHTGTPRELEPTLSKTDYQHILGVVKNMVHVIERSPNTFKGMEEESLRDHFLVQLNGQYEGQATGETFNGSGKTDILIRYNDKNIFLAECKFWRGPKGFQDALAQLFGYATWNDGKLALIIFNRSRNLTQVLKQIPALVADSDHFVREDGRPSDTEFTFSMSHPDDLAKQLTLTVLVFETPE